MASETIAGSCLCGTVKFEIRPPFTGFRYCHCSRCRKASGSAHAANIFLPKGQFAWVAGESALTRYKHAAAQRFAVWFCSQCGTRMPHEIPVRGDMLIPAGALDTDPGMRPEMNIFWESRAPWSVGPQEIAKHSEYP